MRYERVEHDGRSHPAWILTGVAPNNGGYGPLVPDPNNPEFEGNPDPTPATYTWTYAPVPEITNLTGGNSVNAIASDGLIELKLTAANAAAYQALVAAVNALC